MLRLFISLACLNLLVCSLVYFFLPSFRDTLTGEDMIVENTTAITFLITALFSLWFLFKYKTKDNRSLLMFTMLFGIIACLDEISFGERYWELTMPVLANKKIDGLHDFIKLGYSLSIGFLKDLPISVLLFLALALLTVLLLVIKQRRMIWGYASNIILTSKLNTILTSKAFTFLVICGSLVVTAMLIDLGIVRSSYISFLEELFEMNASLALLFCVFMRHNEIAVVQRNYVNAPLNASEKIRVKPSANRVAEELN